MTNEKLLPCPFCGGNPVLVEVPRRIGPDDVFVKCSVCQAAPEMYNTLSRGIDPFIMTYEESQAKANELAVSAWNRRAPTSDGCEYCNIAKANQAVTPVDNTTMCGMRLKYCPNCGRGLGDEDNL